MAYTKHSWLDRIGAGLNKFTNSGTASNLVLTPAPDSITQQGTPFSAAWMNEMEDGIFNAFEILQYATKSAFPATPTADQAYKFFLDQSTNRLWRWATSEYVQVGNSVFVQPASDTPVAQAAGDIWIVT